MYKSILLIIVVTFSFSLSFKEVNSTDSLDNHSLYIVSSDFIPYVFKHKNFLILCQKGKETGIILTHKKKLSDINTIVNANLAAKIVLSSVNSHYKSISGSVEDFFKGKVDAIYFEDFKDLDNKKDIYVYHLDKMIIFPKKIIIGDRNYLLEHKSELSEFKRNLDIVWNGVILSKYYYNDLTPMEDIFYFKTPKSKLFKVYVTTSWPPFHYLSDSNLKGIGIDFWKLIAKKADIDYIFIIVNKWTDVLKAIKRNVADVTPDTSKTPEREKFAYFSKPYISFPFGILCNKRYSFRKISDIKSIAVGKDYTAEKLMKLHYPNIKYIETINTAEALKIVQANKAQCVVDVLPSLMWYLKKENIEDLVLSFKTPFKFDLQVMISKKNKELVKKINKAIDNITPQEKKEIISKYSNVILMEKSSYNFNYLILLIFFIIVAVFIYLFVKLKRRSDMDALTKIYNRGALEREINKILNKTYGSLLFFDLDKFKNINDTYGHEMGDKVLMKFSNLIKNNIRKNDIFGRWGGEEFILVLPEADFKDGIKKAEDLRKLVENFNFNGIKLTVSVGVTEFKKGESIEDVVKRADKALYKAKNLGRNQVRGIK